MIELYEGVPGSGKSYNCVKDKFLPWLRHGRRLYVYIDGISRPLAFEGKDQAEFDETDHLLDPVGGGALRLCSARTRLGGDHR